MAFKLNKNDRRILFSIADCRVLTQSQIAAIQMRSKQVVRRRMRAMENEGLIHSSTQRLAGFRGRPEKIFSLSKKGVHFLELDDTQTKSILQRINEDNFRFLDHQLLINWFQIHLRYMEKTCPALSFRFLSSSSYLLARDDNNRPFTSEQKPDSEYTENTHGFTPDGVFSLSHNDNRKTLLFFLEVDLGSESLFSPKRKAGDIRKKILNYQSYFRNGRYKRYGKIWNCEFKGFRLLFLTNTHGRLVALCKLVRQTPPSNFIWLTTQEKMFSYGLSARIWFSGGKLAESPQSILGTKIQFKSNLPFGE